MWYLNEEMGSLTRLTMTATSRARLVPCVRVVIAAVQRDATSQYYPIVLQAIYVCRRPLHRLMRKPHAQMRKNKKHKIDAHPHHDLLSSTSTRARSPYTMLVYCS